MAEFNDRRPQPGPGQLNLFNSKVRKAQRQPQGPSEPGPELESAARRVQARAINKQALAGRRQRHSEEDDGRPGKRMNTFKDLGMRAGSVPPWASFDGSEPAARTKNSTVKEIPIQDANGPSIATGQHFVSTRRVKEQMESPEKRSNPRLGQKEYPHVYHSPETDQHTIIDGNHRIAGALLRNEMFQPVRVIDHTNYRGVRDDSDRIQEHQANSMDKRLAAAEAKAGVLRA